MASPPHKRSRWTRVATVRAAGAVIHRVVAVRVVAVAIPPVEIEDREKASQAGRALPAAVAAPVLTLMAVRVVVAVLAAAVLANVVGARALSARWEGWMMMVLKR